MIHHVIVSEEKGTKKILLQLLMEINHIGGWQVFSINFIVLTR